MGAQRAGARGLTETRFAAGKGKGARTPNDSKPRSGREVLRRNKGGELGALPPEAGAKQGCCRDEVNAESRCSPKRGRNEGKLGSRWEGAG